MKLLKLTIVLMLLAAITGCNENRIYSKHDTSFPKFRWEKSNKIEFTPEITDANPDYQIYVALRHVHGFQFPSLTVNVEYISPSGKSEKKDYSIKVVGADGEYLSDCAVDLCDLETLVEDKFKFKETGKYKIIVEHSMKQDPLPNVMEVGLIVDKKVVEAIK